MQLHEAIDILKSLNNGYSFSDCEVCENYNELTGTCDKEKCDELIAIETVIAELERMQKENEELKNMDLTTVYLKGVADEKERWINKIREDIDELSDDLEIMKVDSMYGRYKEYGSKFSFEKEFNYKYGMHDVLQDLLKEE